MKKLSSIPLSVKIFLVFCVGALFLWYYLIAYAASIAWDGGGGDANWSTAANWVGDVVPGNLDTAVFDATACGANCNPTISANTSVRGISMTAGTHTITQAPGATLTVGVAGYSQAGAGNVFVGGDSLMQVDGTFTMTSGTFTPTSGTFKLKTNFALNGGTINGSGKTLTFAGDSFSSGGQFSCTGDFNTTTGLAVSFTEEYTLNALNTGCTLSALINTDYLTGYSGHISVATGATLNATGSTWNSGGVTANGTINFNGTSFTSSYLNIPSGGVVSLPNATTFVVGIASDGDLTVSAGGTLTYGGTNFQVNGFYNALSGTFNESGKNLTLGGNGYTIVNCTGNFNTLTGLNSVVMNKNNTYGDPDLSLGPGCTLTLDSVTSPTLDDGSLFSIEGILNITGDADFGNQSGNSGAIIAVLDGGSLNMTGNYWTSGQIEVGGTFTSTASTHVKVYGALYLSRFGNPGTFNAGPLTQLVESQDGYTGDFSINGGTYNASSGTLEVANDFAGSSLFNADTGTVVLNGTSLQAISGDTTFYNLTATSSIARTLRFANSSTQIISNNLTLRGSLGALISLISNSTPTAWKINGQGTNTLCYLSVKDSNNLNATALSGYQLTDATGNTNWDFVSTSSCGTPTPTVEFSSSSGSGNESTASPTITVSLSATSASNVTVQYGITGGTATGSGTDYTLASGTATILAGATTTTIPLTIVDDSTVESDETVIISLSSPSNATLGSTLSLTYTITNDDVASSGGGGGGGAGGNGPVVGQYNSVVKNPQSNGKNATSTSSSNPVNIEACIAAKPQLSPSSVVFNKNLVFKQTDPLVKALQIFLNKNDFVVEKKGEGSLGNESDYFGPGTKNALNKLQTVYKKIIETYFGKINQPISLDKPTRDFVNSLATWETTVCGRTTPPLPPPIPPPVILPVPVNLPPEPVVVLPPPAPVVLPPVVIGPEPLPVEPPVVIATSTEIVASSTVSQSSTEISTTSVDNSNPSAGSFVEVIQNTISEAYFAVAGSVDFIITPVVESVSGVADAVIQAEVVLSLQIPHFKQKLETINKMSAYVVVPVVTAVAYSVPIQEKLIHVSGVKDAGIVFTQAIQALLAFLGLRKKRKHWGTVYDSKTKQPIDPAIIRLIDAHTGKVVEEAVTDMAGRYGFLSRQGTFFITAEKTHYTFPSQVVSGTSDEIFDNVYHGGIFMITDVSATVVPNIPMDALEFDWNQLDKKRIIKMHPRLEYVFTLLSDIVFWAGLIIAIVTYFFYTTTENLLIMYLYGAILVISVLLSSLRLWGRVVGRGGMQVADMLIELISPRFDTVVLSKARTAPDGKFFLKADKGEYVLKVKQRDVSSGEMKEVKSTKVEVGKVGVMNENIYLS